MIKKIGLVIMPLVLSLGITMTTYAAPQQMPDGEIFDAEYYAQNNPDVVAVLGTDIATLYEHYKVAGKNEGRKPYDTNNVLTLQKMSDGGYFDAVYYAQNNPDVVAVLGTDANILYEHYKASGINEGRKPYDTNSDSVAQMLLQEQLNNVKADLPTYAGTAVYIIRSQLKDPYTAKFTEINAYPFIYKGKVWVVTQVGTYASNSFGAYSIDNMYVYMNITDDVYSVENYYRDGIHAYELIDQCIITPMYSYDPIALGYPKIY